MFPAHDRRRFSRELQSLARIGAHGDKAEAGDDDRHARMAAANKLLEDVVKPLLESYTEMVRNLGRSCDYKVLTGSAESHPIRAAVAEFWLDLTEIPGVSQYFMRLKSDGDGWRVMSRPSLAQKSRRHEIGRDLAAGRQAVADAYRRRAAAIHSPRLLRVRGRKPPRSRNRDQTCVRNGTEPGPIIVVLGESGRGPIGGGRAGCIRGA